MHSPHYFEIRQEQVLAAMPAGTRSDAESTMTMYRFLTAGTLVNVSGKTLTMGEFLDEAHARGMARKEAKQNVIVHPQWVLSPDVTRTMRRMPECMAALCNMDIAFPESAAEKIIAKMQGQYVALLGDIMKPSDRPIVVEYEGAREDYPGLVYDPSRAVPSAHVGEKASTGFLDAQGLVGLSELMDGFRPQEPVDVSGSTYGVCPPAFAFQLLMARELGLYVPDHKALGLLRQTTEMSYLAHRTPLARESRIRMRILFDCMGKRMVEQMKGEQPGHPEFYDGREQIVPADLGAFGDVLQEVLIETMMERA